MTQTHERVLMSATAWQKAVAREAVIRPIAFQKSLTAPERFAACTKLGLKPTAVQSGARKKPGNRQADAPRPQ
ncbi:hypothetical protein AWN88_00895 [Agrobacterium tumefaciens]|nr:hypothetical protein AWN88_00895 [Agrobacterium tumefaciens]KAJ32894.1 hypothetical protein BW45_17415 [Agrobacterium tumefaciens]